MNSGRFQRLKQFFFSWREVIQDFVTQMQLPKFSELVIRELPKDEPKQEPKLPSFSELTVKAPSDLVIQGIDKQEVQAPQFGKGEPTGTLLMIEEPMSMEQVAGVATAAIPAEPTPAVWPFPVGELTVTPIDVPVETSTVVEITKKRNPRPRLAKGINTFRQEQGKGHALFYRYLRIPDQYNRYEPGPKGGSCILVDMLDSEKFTFSFAVCSPVDAFIKDEARRMCQERYTAGTTCTVTQRDDSYSCYENIGFAIRNFFEGVDDPLEPKLLINTPNITEQQLKGLLKAIDSWSPVGQ